MQFNYRRSDRYFMTLQLIRYSKTARVLLLQLGTFQFTLTWGYRG